MKRRFLLIATALAVGGLLPLPCEAALTPATSSGWGVDDWNTSTLNPNTVNGGKNTPTFYTAQCPWITTAMDAFVGANANYTYQWAVPTFNLQSNLSVTDYSAWVVTSPNTANGFNFTGGIANQDVGGADFGLTYTPTAANSPQNIFFIQAYIANRNGVLQGATLDNTGATPWYGGASSYGTGGAASKMGDEPYRTEVEAQDPSYYASFQFQTVVATDNKENGKDNLTVYQGAEWWGYDYTTSDIRPNAVPEPSTIALLLVGLVGAGALRKRQSSRKARKDTVLRPTMQTR